MNFAKTFCTTPGSTVALIPAGLPVKLVYNEHGLLQKFTVGFDFKLDPMYEDNTVDADFKEGNFKYNELFNAIKRIVPQAISTTGGTTWIYGVCYTDKIPCAEGDLTTGLINSYMNDMIKGGLYRFYAGYVTSKAISIRGYLVMKSFLGAAGFKLLPSTLVPVAMTQETIASIINAPSYPFKKEFIAGLFVHENLNSKYASTGLFQIKITDVSAPFVDEDGFLKGNISTASGKVHMLDYSTIVHHDVTEGSCLLVERGINTRRISILVTRVNELSQKTLNNIGTDIKCPVCRKLYRVGTDDAPVQCDDPHCLSRGYEDVVKLLAVLNLPAMDYTRYKNLVDAKEIMCLTDILEISPYNANEIEATLAEAMYAVIPTSVVPNFSVLERFANRCNNKVDTVVYYLDNPLRIETDLDITDPIIRRFAAWLEDPYNLTTLTTIFSQVKILGKRQKFDGAPIFRGNRIAITGRFKRGDYPEIESILMSYAATVMPSIELGQPLPDVVIIGALNEGISGQMIQKAKMHNIPVVYEDDFFTRYEIDKDLKENLL